MASSSLHLSRNQEAILQFLDAKPGPLSAQDIHAALRQQHRVGLATVYRALEALKLRGLVQSRSAVNGEALYSLTQEDRHYLTCLQCGQSQPLDTCPVHALEEHLKSSQSFKIYYHNLEFFGLCAVCDQALEDKN
jgi:Fur family transcriptional regulator, ferric uptake regulator